MTAVSSGFKRTTISLRPEEYEVLRFVAFKRKTSVAGVVRGMIRELLEEEEDIREGLKALKNKRNTLDWTTFKREYLGLQGRNSPGGPKTDVVTARGSASGNRPSH